MFEAYGCCIVSSSKIFHLHAYTFITFKYSKFSALENGDCLKITEKSVQWDIERVLLFKMY